MLAAGLLAVVVGRQAPEMPNPNGYDRLLALAAPIPNHVGDLDQKGAPTTAQFVAAHPNVVADAQRALELRAVVPVVYTSAWLGKRMPELMSIRRLEKALLAWARHSQSFSDLPAATAARLAAVKLGQNGFRGGLLIDFMVGSATQISGLTELSNSVPAMDVAGCQLTLTEVHALQSSQEPLSSHVGRERRWILFGSEWWKNLDWELVMTIPGMLLNPAKQDAMLVDQTPLQRSQELQLAYAGVESALRARLKELQANKPSSISPQSGDGAFGFPLAQPLPAEIVNPH